MGFFLSGTWWLKIWMDDGHVIWQEVIFWNLPTSYRLCGSKKHQTCDCMRETAKKSKTEHTYFETTTASFPSSDPLELTTTQFTTIETTDAPPQATPPINLSTALAHKGNPLPRTKVSSMPNAPTYSLMAKIGSDLDPTKDPGPVNVILYWVDEPQEALVLVDGGMEVLQPKAVLPCPIGRGGPLIQVPCLWDAMIWEHT